MTSPTQNTAICPYSVYSFQFFLLFPIAKLCQQLSLPTLLGYVLALGAPVVLLEYLVRLLDKNQHIVLIEHAPSQPGHQHSSAMTIKVILHSAILGIIFTTGLSFVQNQNLEQHFVPLGFYLMLLSTFHFGEYFVTSLTNPSTLTLSSFLLDQSYAYVIAISSSFVEYTLEAYMFENFKKFSVISMVGLVFAIAGEVIRKMAMFTAGKNFSHTIKQIKSSEHKLVTHGIYSCFRHPSYAGWFYWAVGSQMMLLNPICVIIFTVISYRFFKDRIVYEEKLLIDFFNEDYKSYRKRVGLWMPLAL